MAKMIPSQFDVSTSSQAEKRLFELLKSDPETKDWIVLHSLGLSKRGKKPYGEIDFVVLIPSFGVFCLEVKGGGVSCFDGQWQTINHLGDVHKFNRSPFLQAREGMFALRDSIMSKATASVSTGLIFGYAVVFPDVVFREQSPEWEPWQVIDRERLKKPISTSLLSIATAQRKMNPNIVPGEPSAGTLKQILQILRPDFEIIVSRSTQIDETEANLLKLTHEQYLALDLLEENDRCLFEGPAGTGKTMLAFEYARRSAMAGNRTLFICYNRLLGDWLEREASIVGKTSLLVAGGFHKLLRERIKHSTISHEFLDQEIHDKTPEFYMTKYPMYGQLAIEELGEKFDVCVMDEAQDLTSEGVMEVLSTWIKRGVDGGRWAFFGDFQRQAIFNSSTADEMKSIIANATLQYAKGKLRMNCRNTRNIGEETALMSGFDSLPYKMGQIEGLPVDYRFYGSEEEQNEFIVSVIRRLFADGVKAADIVILSQKRFSNSNVSHIAHESGFRLEEVNETNSQRSRLPVVRYSTIQAFKGMESPVVILCDVENVLDREMQSLLYVAMSRARSLLVLMLHKRVKPYYGECLQRRIKESWYGEV